MLNFFKGSQLEPASETLEKLFIHIGESPCSKKQYPGISSSLYSSEELKEFLVFFVGQTEYYTIVTQAGQRFICNLLNVLIKVFLLAVSMILLSLAAMGLEEVSQESAITRIVNVLVHEFVIQDSRSLLCLNLLGGKRCFIAHV